MVHVPSRVKNVGNDSDLYQSFVSHFLSPPRVLFTFDLSPPTSEHSKLCYVPPPVFTSFIPEYKIFISLSTC